MGLKGWTGEYDFRQALSEMYEAGAYLYELRETAPNSPIRYRDKIRWVARVRKRNTWNTPIYFGTHDTYMGNALREAVEKFIVARSDTGPGRGRPRLRKKQQEKEE